MMPAAERWLELYGRMFHTSRRVSSYVSGRPQEGQQLQPPQIAGVVFGGAEGIRTPDLLNAIQTRSQLRHGPKRQHAFARAVLSVSVHLSRVNA